MRKEGICVLEMKGCGCLEKPLREELGVIVLGVRKLMSICVPIPELSQQLRFERLWEQARIVLQFGEGLGEQAEQLIGSVADKAFKGEL